MWPRICDGECTAGVFNREDYARRMVSKTLGRIVLGAPLDLFNE